MTPGGVALAALPFSIKLRAFSNRFDIIRYRKQGRKENAF